MVLLVPDALLGRQIFSMCGEPAPTTWVVTDLGGIYSTPGNFGVAEAGKQHLAHSLAFRPIAHRYLGGRGR